MKKKIRSLLHMVMYTVVVWFGTYFVINYAGPGLLHLHIYDGEGQVIGQHVAVGVKIMDGYGVTDTEFTEYVEKTLERKYGEEFVVIQYTMFGAEKEWEVKAYPVSNPNEWFTVYEVSAFYQCSDSYYSEVHRDELCDKVYDYISPYGVERENLKIRIYGTYSYAGKKVAVDKLHGSIGIELYVQDEEEAKALEGSVDGMVDALLETFSKLDGIKVEISDKSSQEGDGETYYNEYYPRH